MNRLFVASLTFAAALLAASPALRADEPPADGAALFRTKTCVACHGRDGGRAIQSFPDLAGQGAKYLFEQMNDIADGKRVSGNDARGYPRTQGMKDVMHLVSAPERQMIADWLATLPPPKLRPLDPPASQEALAAGKEAYQKGGCASCHGADGLKPTAGYPKIGGMKRAYLVLQMTEIKDGVRQNGKVKTMLPFAKRLDDAKIAAIADYLSQVDATAVKP